MGSLWGDEFVIAPTPKVAKKVVQKVNNPLTAKALVTKTVKSKSVSLRDKLRLITENVLRILGVYKENTVVIKTREQLHDYIDKAIINNIIAIDTETNNSLDPITCLLMGGCIYTPGEKNAYIPINHVNLETRERLEWQLTEQDIKEEFLRLKDTPIVMHNGKFDYEVIKCTCGIPLNIYWDTMIGARILDENERSAGLKQQYINKIDPSIEKYDIENLFEKVEYAIVDPDIFALYSATDAYMTYKLYEWQKKQFEKADLVKLYSLFMNVEMPIVTVTAEMELAGIEINQEYAARLSVKYHKLLDAIDTKIADELKTLEPTIAQWRTTPDAKQFTKVSETAKNQKTKGEQLADPPSMTSPTQLAILLYDVLRVKPVDTKTPRGTGEDILTKIDIPLCKLILEKRGIEKLIGTYVDKLPACVSVKDKRLHAHFNSMGTDTGRFSSTDPNLQNIPSHSKDIRKMFTAQKGYKLVGSDFSQQEPRLLSHYSQDDNMISAYKNGKDLYATIASGVYKVPYEQCLEKYSPEGKKRRSSCKSLLLGIMYGRGVASIAEQIHGTVEDAQKIVDTFYSEFPKVKKWMDESVNSAKTLGYVEDICGRRRRLPDIQLPKYTITSKNNQVLSVDFNPLLGATGKCHSDKPNLIDAYREKLNKCRGRNDVEDVKRKALADGITIVNNGAFISQAERQCVNSRVQGGSATITKIAMINVSKDEILKQLGFKMLICVHDELIGECPEENAEAVAERLSKVMIESAGSVCSVPMKCDAEITTVWYETDYADTLHEEFEKRLTAGEIKEDIFNSMCDKNCESTREELHQIFADLL